MSVMFEEEFKEIYERSKREKESINVMYYLWKEVEAKKNKFKLWERIYNWMDRDRLGAVLVYNKTFWFETTCSWVTIPNYVFDRLKKLFQSKGFVYLWDI